MGLRDTLLEKDPMMYFRSRIQEETYLHLRKERLSGPVLDIGCALGPSWAFLADMYVVGIDINLDEIAITRAKQYEVNLIVADAHHLPLKNDSATVILCQEVLEHLEHPTITLQEVFRVLKCSGILLISVPCLLDKITVPALAPIVILCERLVKAIFRGNIKQRDAQPEKNREEDLGIVKMGFRIFAKMPIDYLRVLCFRFFWLLLTVRYCMREHRNKYAWLWIPLIKHAGFEIEKIQACAVLYPLALISRNLGYLYLCEKKIRTKHPFRYLGQLLCMTARRK